MKKIRNLKLFLINGSISCLSLIIIQIIAIIFNVYISNKIGAQGVGTYAIILSLLNFSITMSCFGLNLASTKVISSYLAINENKKAIKSFKLCLILSFLASILAIIIIFIFSDIIQKIILKNTISKKVIYYIMLSLPFISLSACINGFFNSIRKVYKNVILTIIEQFFKILFTFLFIINKVSIESTICSLMLANLLSVVISFVVGFSFYLYDKRKIINNLDFTGFDYKFNLKEKTKNKNKNLLTINFTYLKEIFQIAVPIGTTSIIRAALSTIKHMMIPLRLQKTGIGYAHAMSLYGIINAMVMPIILFPSVVINSFATLLIPEFTRLHKLNYKKRIKFLTNRIFKIVFSFSFFVLTTFLTFYNFIANTFYPSEALVPSYIIYLCPLISIMYIDTVADCILKGLNKQVDVMKINILDLVTSTILIFFLIPILGVKAYILILYISEFLNGILSIYLIIKYTKIKFNIYEYIIVPLTLCIVSRTIYLKLVSATLNTNLIFGIFLFSFITLAIFLIFQILSKISQKKSGI